MGELAIPIVSPSQSLKIVMYTDRLVGYTVAVCCWQTCGEVKVGVILFQSFKTKQLFVVGKGFRHIFLGNSATSHFELVIQQIASFSTEGTSSVRGRKSQCQVQTFLDTPLSPG